MTETTIKITEALFRDYLHARKLLSAGITMGPEDRDEKVAALRAAKEALTLKVQDLQRRAAVKADSDREAERQYARVAGIYAEDFQKLDQMIEELEGLYK